MKKKSNLKPMLYFNFLNIDMSLIMKLSVKKCHTNVKYMHMERTVSQILYLGLSFYLIWKTGNFLLFFEYYFLDSIIKKLRYKSKF